MRVETLSHDVFPKVVRAGHPCLITVRPRFDHGRFQKDVLYDVALHPTEEAGLGPEDPIPGQWHVKPKDGAIQFTPEFRVEQEYTLMVVPTLGAKSSRPLEFRLYAVEDDLFPLYPWRGDFHLHSDRSDGKESPAYVAAASRRIGLDFMALTDHHRYTPSLEAIQAFERLPVDLRIFPGEEVHAPENRVHIVNFGGRFSVNDLFQGDAYKKEVQAIEDGIEGLPTAALRRQYASCLWVYAKIREAGGLAVFCHPYWVTQERYNVPEALIARHFEDMPFDALELIGGYHRHELESNQLQVGRYHEERARGRSLPIVGASDSHGCENGELFGWFSSIVWAPTPALSDLIAGVKACRAVAVDAIPGEAPRVHGPFRLMKYGLFLLREVLPLHDALCAEEGQCMLAHLAGEDREEELARRRGQVAALYRRLWARP